MLLVHDYGDRLQRHIETQYPNKESAADQVQRGTSTSTSTNKGRTYAIVRVYWKLREGILEKLHATGFKRIKIPLLLLLDISTIAYTILNVEFSLRMNNIDGIYDMWSVGQLIPVIIGAGGIGVAAAELYVYLREKRGVAWGSLGVARIGQTKPETAESSSQTESSTPAKGTPLHFEDKQPDLG